MPCRCPNPAACQHNTSCLIDHHPNDRMAQAANKSLSWTEYGSLLCTPGKGYKGIMCATCEPGWGVTGPFECKRCIGVVAGATEQARRPSVVYISLLYLLYWVVQTTFSIIAVVSAVSLAQPRQRFLRNSAFKSCEHEDVRGALNKDPIAMDIVKVSLKRWRSLSFSSLLVC